MRAYKIYLRNGKEIRAVQEITWREKSILNGCIGKIEADDDACLRFCMGPYASKKLSHMYCLLGKISTDDRTYDKLLNSFLRLLKTELLRTYEKQRTLVYGNCVIVRLKDRDNPWTHRPMVSTW